MKQKSLGLSLVVWTVIAGFFVAPAARGQKAFSGDGVVESTSGGFKFPDGTVQVTAAAGAEMAPVEETGQQICYDPTGSTRNTTSCASTGQDGEK